MSSTDIGARMKDYEACFTFSLPRRMPLIVRVDGRAFHTLTADMQRPFDRRFCDAMVHAASRTAATMQGFAFGYVQSDEASFFLRDDEALDTEPWFGKNLAKIISISAATMSVHFCSHLGCNAVFDARTFVMPIADVPNYFVWRAKDWERNSLNMFCRAHFRHDELHGKSRTELHDMLHAIGRNWTTDLDARCRNGTFLVRTEGGIETRSDVLPTYPSITEAMGSASAWTD